MEEPMRKSVLFLIPFLLFSGFLFAQDRESEDFSYPLKLYKQEFYDLAAQQFIKFYNTYPNSDKVDDAKYYAGMALYKLKEYDKARAEFQSLALEFPKSPFAAEAWFLVGDCAEKLGDFKAAAHAYESLRVLYPRDNRAALAVFKAAVIYAQKLNDLKKAAQLFNVVIERYASSEQYLPALIKKAGVMFALGRVDEARKLLNKAFQIQNAPAKVLAEAHLLQGNINNRLGFVEKAKKEYQIALKLAPKTRFAGQAAIELGKIYLQEKKYAVAIPLLKKQLAVQSDSALVNALHYLLADEFFLSKQYKAAAAQYKTIRTTDDSLRLVIRLKRALCFKKQNFISEAISLLSAAMEDKRFQSLKIYSQIYDIYLDWLQEYRYFTQAASSIYQRLTQTENVWQRAYLVGRLLPILAKKKQWAEMVSLAQPFLLAQQRLPEKDDLLFYLALAKENLNETHDAAYYYKKLIREFNASIHIEKAKQHLKFLQDFQLVDLDVAMNNLADLYGASLFATPAQKAKIALKLGKLYFNDLKNYQKAEKQFQTVLEMDSTQAGDVHLYLGKTYLKILEYLQYKGLPTKNYLYLANEQFKLAVMNKATCSRPDESAWLLVKTSVRKDSSGAAQEKKIVEALLKKYPKSPLKEEWLRSLALDLAFDASYTQESIRYFKLLIEKYPHSEQMPRYLLTLARLELDTDPQLAEQYLQKLIGNYMFTNEAALAMNDLLHLYSTQERYAEAIALYEKMHTYFYYSDLVKQNDAYIGELYLKAGEYDKAVALLRQNTQSAFLSDLILLKEFQPSTVSRSIFYLAEAYRMKNAPRLAIHYYQLYLQLEPKGTFSDRAHFYLARLYQKAGQYFLARSNFEAVSTKDAQLYTQAVIQAGDIYFLEQDYAQAAALYETALRHIEKPDLKIKISAKYIISLIRQGKVTLAKKLMAAFKKKHPSEKDYLAQFNIELGNYYRLTKNFNLAQKYFSKVKKKYKSTEYVDDAEYFNALVLITLNKHKEALKILTNFADRYPQSNQLPGVYNTLGTLYFRSEKYDAAIAMFKKAMEYCNGCELEANIMTNLIKVYSLTGFWDAAQAMARNYLEKFPEAPDRLDKKIIIARAYINLNQFQKAVDYLKSIKIEADAEREPEIQFYIGEALLKAGRYEEAIAEFVKIPLLSKKTKLQWEASALYYSGQCYEKLGRIDDAIRMYKEIIKRPGIDLVLKRDAEKRIKQIQ